MTTKKFAHHNNAVGKATETASFMFLTRSQLTFSHNPTRTEKFDYFTLCPVTHMIDSASGRLARSHRK